MQEDEDDGGSDSSDLNNMSPEEMAEYQRQSCIFCKIIKGDIPSKKPYEDDKIVSVMDINPAAKGHLLIMTKEHYPILPVIPIDTAAQMFRTTKHLSKAMKQAMVTDKATIFIANGAIAGQQSPHFLYHIIPRENNDNLDNFNIPAKEFREDEVKQPLILLKGKIGLMMRQFKAQKSKSAPAVSTASAVSAAPATPATFAASTGAPLSAPQPKQPGAYKDLAQFIDQNPQIRDAIIKNPEAFKAELEVNPELKKFFAGININKLSEALKKIN